MKTNELMVKDWVCCNDEPCCIWMVDWQYNLVRCHRNGTEWTCGTEEITPIKLTTNILLDSGFESVSDSLVSMKCYTLNDKDDMYICIEFHDNGRIYLEINSKRKIIIISRIDFVHELQHILRTCGLNDIDDNIKVLTKGNKMSKIFEGAKLGDAFKTKDGRKAIYHYYENRHYLITDGGGDIACGDDGDDTENDCDNIVGRWDESIDEKPLAYCYNCKTTFSYDKKTLEESGTMSVKCPRCGTDICLLD